MDFNNDGILDLVLGERDGYYNFYTGNGDGTLHFIGNPYDDLLNPIERNYNSAGYLDDWNEDGYIDFIAGGYEVETWHGGRLEVHLNISDDLTSPIWSSSTIDLTPVCDYWRVTHETCDLNQDGKKDLIFGYEMGNVWYAENIGTNSDPQFNGFIQLMYDGGEMNIMTITGNGRARENVTDFNNDGILDVIVGCGNGMVYLFEGYDPTGIAGSPEAGGSGIGLHLSCSPTSGHFSAQFTLAAAASVAVTVFDASGRVVKSLTSFQQAGAGSVPIDLTGHAAGMYMISASSGTLTETAKLIKIE